MTKKILSRCVTILAAGVLVFLLAYFTSYKITTNKYKVSSAAEATTDWVADAQTQAATTAVPTEPEEEEETEPPVPFDATKLAEARTFTMPENDAWSLVVISQFYKPEASYEPFVEQVLPDSAIYLDQRVAQAFRAMYNAALADGVELTLSAGYVTPDRQERRFNKQVQAYMEQGLDRETAKAHAAYIVLPAGCSESNYGLAVDIGWPEDDFADSPAYLWLKNNAAKYGFIERYTAEKTDVTHFHAEPWHWRYVGAAAAQEMVTNNLCLEEYRQQVNRSVNAEEETTEDADNTAETDEGGEESADESDNN